MTGTESAGALLPVLAFGAAAVLAAVHVFIGHLKFLDTVPRSWWLSLAGGASVAYVFVHILPEVQAAATTVEERRTVLTFLDHHVYLVALAGFTLFFGLERFVRSRSHGEYGDTPVGVFWLHVGSFAAYNALVGYLLLHREETGVLNLALFTLALALHFVVNDYGLRTHHGDAYHDRGRWVLAAAVFIGVGVGYVWPVSELLLAVLFSFLSGSVILNVVKEELPAERQSRFWAFAAGAVGYTLLLLVA